MAGSRFRSTGAPTTALQSACSCSRWLRTSLLGFYGGWGLAEKSPHSLRVALSWMTPSETLLRLCLGGFGDMKWAWGGGWRLPAFLCQTTSSPGFCPISRAHFRDRKTLRKRVHHKGPPLKHGCSRKCQENSSNQGHYTPSAVVKCKFPLSELRGEATYCSRWLRTVRIPREVEPCRKKPAQRCASGHSWMDSIGKTLL